MTSWGGVLFLSTPSARRATNTLTATAPASIDFYPRPPRGGRPGCGLPRSPTTHFYPRPPRGGRPAVSKQQAYEKTIISIHALREEGDWLIMSLRVILTQDNFYPRPPRGGRPQLADELYNGISISIHALREEGDFATSVSLPIRIAFLSTPSARRAT